MCVCVVCVYEGGAVWNATVGKPWPVSPHTAYACLNVLSLAMLFLACHLPISLNMPKSELLKQQQQAATAQRQQAQHGDGKHGRSGVER